MSFSKGLLDEINGRLDLKPGEDLDNNDLVREDKNVDQNADKISESAKRELSRVLIHPNSGKTRDIFVGKYHFFGKENEEVMFSGEEEDLKKLYFTPEVISELYENQDEKNKTTYYTFDNLNNMTTKTKIVFSGVEFVEKLKHNRPFKKIKTIKFQIIKKETN